MFSFDLHNKQTNTLTHFYKETENLALGKIFFILKNIICNTA